LKNGDAAFPIAFRDQVAGAEPILLSKRLLQGFARLAKEKERGLTLEGAVNGLRAVIDRR